ncbi:hypothetical protein N7466_004165 [Penicillium verhagenii]|uniref:uncharacterized protein n=1 Tax=Penicillium verhagenii TaxID=1562060 RepID=UPI002544E57C|nr:uncharacterized protein N7466_004165 [Penicillium verhagenii]KAJ5934618.1 hypothetical protein N7466_004165 [Penicillium verhagenii]
MADMNQVSINGNYPAQHAYPESFNPAHATMNTAANFQPGQSSTPTTVTPTPTEQQKNEITKDEVGWFFVEQYYTTMSRNPDKLPLFYSRRSQLVFGTEAESVPVAIGTKAINDKIKELDFQDCKVRVLNVDSQASFDNILVAVIGEISNKSEPSRKFAQTFVLAQQPSGYYVLNDIFRYLSDEEELVEEAVEPVIEATEVPEPVATPEAQVTDEVAASKVDEKLENETNGVVEQAEETVPQTNGTPVEEVKEVKEVEEVEETPIPAVETEVVNDEKPATPEPTPVAVQKEAPAEKESAPTPAIPKSWASIASSTKLGAAPVVPAIPAATPKAAAPAASAAQPAATPTAAAAPAAVPAAETRSQDAPSADAAGWQTAGAEHKKTQSRAEEQVVLGYMKNVTEKVDFALLKQTLSRFGKLKFFDINRPKNCAFVEFAEPSGYAAAVAANPHSVSGEQILIEERRPRGNAFGGNGFAGRGGARGRGDRTGSQGGRGGFQREGRGGFAPRGRGGNVAANKGRSQTQAA